MTSMTITLEARRVLSYAMAHNEIPVISRLAIENVPADLPGARLRLDVTDATGPATGTTPTRPRSSGGC